MTRDECVREIEVARAALARRAGCSQEDGDLLAHADGCAACREALALAAAFAECRDEALRDARVPAAGQVWWRSALRAHAEASRAARRPLVWLLGVSVACTVAVAVALFPVAVLQAYGIAQAAFEASAGLTPNIARVIEGLGPAVRLAAVLLACLTLAPVVVYLALSDGKGD